MTAIVYYVIPSKVWVHGPTGRTASIYGACPWATLSDKPNWSVEQRGWTVKNVVDGTVGVGRKPWATEQEARAWVDAEHARRSAARRALGVV